MEYPNHFSGPDCPCSQCEKWRKARPREYAGMKGQFNPPVSRSTDPVTSHEAEAAVTASGSRASQQRKFLRQVRDFPGSTAGEMADRLGMTMHEASRRLADLNNARKIRKGEPKVYAGTNRRQVTWWPV